MRRRKRETFCENCHLNQRRARDEDEKARKDIGEGDKGLQRDEEKETKK